MKPPSIDEILAMPEEFEEADIFSRSLEVPFNFGGLDLTIVYRFIEDKEEETYEIDISIKEFPYHVGFIAFRDYPKPGNVNGEARWLRLCEFWIKSMKGRLPDDADYCWYERQQMGGGKRKPGSATSI